MPDASVEYAIEGVVVVLEEGINCTDCKPRDKRDGCGASRCR